MKFSGNWMELFEQAQKLQENVTNIQEKLEEKTVEASSGGGMVTVTVSGTMKVISLSLDPVVVNPQDIGMLEDLVQAAVNEGLRKAKDLVKQELSNLTGGLPIPGLS